MTDYRGWMAAQVNRCCTEEVPMRRMRDAIVDVLTAAGGMLKREELIDQIGSREGIEKDEDLKSAVQSELRDLVGEGAVLHPRHGYYQIAK